MNNTRIVKITSDMARRPHPHLFGDERIKDNSSGMEISERRIHTGTSTYASRLV